MVDDPKFPIPEFPLRFHYEWTYDPMNPTSEQFPRMYDLPMLNEDSEEGDDPMRGHYER